MKCWIKKLSIVLALAVNVGVSTFAFAEDPLPEEKLDPKKWAKLYDLHGCESDDVLCLRGDGTSVSTSNKGPDRLSNNVVQGTAITIKIIGCVARYTGVKFEIGLEAMASGDQLFRADSTASLGTAVARASTSCDKVEDYALLSSASVTVPNKPAKIAITFKRHATQKLPELTASYSAKVIRGLYFLDIGFAAPFVIGGERKISAVRDPGVDLRRLELEQDLLIKPAVMLNVFPGGRRLGALTSFARDRDCSDMGSDKTKCKLRNVGRGFANSLGLQFGLSLDTESFGKQFYLGAILEPVVGLNLGFGLALIQGEYYRDGFTDGQLIAADVAASEWGREKMMARPYFSVAFSLDIFRNVRAAMNNQEITSLASGGSGG